MCMGLRGNVGKSVTSATHPYYSKRKVTMLMGFREYVKFLIWPHCSCWISRHYVIKSPKTVAEVHAVDETSLPKVNLFVIGLK